MSQWEKEGMRVAQSSLSPIYMEPISVFAEGPPFILQAGAK